MENKQQSIQIMIKKCPKCKNYYYIDYFCDRCGLCLNCCKCEDIPFLEEGFTNFYITEE